MQPQTNQQPPYKGKHGQRQPSVPQGGAYQPPQPQAPVNLEDTGFAPELRSERSENLYRRDARFWQDVTGGQTSLTGTPKQTSYFQHVAQFRKSRRNRPRGRQGSHVLPMVLCLTLMVVAVVILFASPMFEVKAIQVVGNSRVSAGEIVQRSGLKVGMNRFLVDSHGAAERIEGNCNLICELVHMKDMNTLEIRVKEREVVAIIDYNGLLYFVDNRGMILEEFANRELIRNSGKIHVLGLDIRRCDLGRIIILGSEEQLSVYNDILIELKVMSALDQMVELDMSSMDSIFLETSDGFTVRLGNGADVHRKLRSMLLTLEKLREGGYPPGNVDVSAPVTPSYIPYESA